MRAKLTFKLTRAEAEHVLSVMFENEREGWYWGPKAQYWKRHERIKAALQAVLAADYAIDAGPAYSPAKD